MLGQWLARKHIFQLIVLASLCPWNSVKAMETGINEIDGGCYAKISFVQSEKISLLNRDRI